tara:strand:+ start:5036 stop:5626 length:591 start_codon:yes stop_codon:yes gene_type:complete
MAKLYFNYSTMNAGKSTLLLQAAYNYEERKMKPILFTANLDDRAGVGIIKSRIGIERSAEIFKEDTNLLSKTKEILKEQDIQCLLIDEAQFLSKKQVWELASIVDDLKIPVLCYGLRVDFKGELFSGSKALLCIADEIREIKTICFCGKKATMVVRKNEKGETLTSGGQIEIGGNEKYISLCRKHWKKAFNKKIKC